MISEISQNKWMKMIKHPWTSTCEFKKFGQLIIMDSNLKANGPCFFRKDFDLCTQFRVSTRQYYWTPPFSKAAPILQI